jgi:4-amino-4-deoxy-L-arabinose transferase-like glycosyltransferase
MIGLLYQRQKSPMTITFRLKQAILRTDKILLVALLISFSLSLYGITVKYNNPDQMAFLPLFLKGKLPFNPGWFDKPPFHTYLNYFLSVLPVSVLSKNLAFSPQTEEIVKIVWSRLLTKFMLIIAIGLLYQISWKSYGLLSARTIAVIAATTAGFIAYSHFLTVDIPVMFWMLVTFAFSHSILFERKLSNYLLAGFFTGIAAATKYNGVAIGISIVAAHVLSLRIVSWKQIPWKEILFDKNLIAGLVMVAVGFLAANPFALLDYPAFSSGFLYNYMVAPVYEGQTGHSFIRFFGTMIEIIGLPFFIVSTVAFLFALSASVFAWEDWKKRATILLCLSVLIPYYIQFGMFPRLETRFVLPIMPIWLLMSGLFWGKLRPHKAILGLLLVSLLGYNLICSLYVGRRFLDDPRLQAEIWVKENMVTGSSVEKDVYSPSWMYMPEVQAKVTAMPFVTGREELFELLFPENVFINGTEADRLRAGEKIAWFSEEELMRRNPNYIVVDSLYYQRFIQPGIRRDLYPSMYEYFDALLSEEFSYEIVFDQESKKVPAWIYPKDIDFTHNRVTILASNERQTSR